MKKLLITGANGYIARNIIKAFKGIYDIENITHTSCDLTLKYNVDNFFQSKYFDCVIHTAIQGGRRTKEDSKDIVFNNTLMFMNLMDNKGSFGKFINLGSGAEIYAPTTPYGLSKKLIYQIGRQYPEFVSLRIFNVFNEDEAPDRMIYNNIVNHISYKSLHVHQNRYMDFFSMEDFLKVLEYTIEMETDNCINCCYDKKYTLNDIIDIINRRESVLRQVTIDKPGIGSAYIGKSNLPLLDYTGLVLSIDKMYNKIKHLIFTD